MVFNSLTVIREASGRASNGGIKWICRCKCGKEFVTQNVKRQINCGCEHLGMKGKIPWNKGLLGYNKNLIRTPEWNAHVAIGVKGYYADKLKKTRQGPLGCEWRQKILGRDFNICRVCGRLATIAHHICTRQDFIEYIFELWNGISVCKGCHNRVHRMQDGLERLWVITSIQVELFRKAIETIPNL